MACRELASYNVSSAVSVKSCVKWSQDNKIGLVTQKGVHIFGGNSPTLSMMAAVMFVLLIMCSLAELSSSEVLASPPNFSQAMPAAFGDFDGDKLTDLFVITDKRKTVKLIIAHEQEPFFELSNIQCNFTNFSIVNVVPSDFDGDGLMDLLVVGRRTPSELEAHVLYGDLEHLNCTDETKPLFKLLEQPLVLDYNQDMISDVFGIDGGDGTTRNKSCFWVFDKERGAPKLVPMVGRERNGFRRPHSNAIVDLNSDFNADLVITTDKNTFERWLFQSGAFVYDAEFHFPPEADKGHIGQSVFFDLRLTGNIDHLVPVCKNMDCSDSSLYVFINEEWHEINISLQDSNRSVWGFVPPNGGKYTDTITIRAGDFNLDGYPDLLATLAVPGHDPRVFLLENVPGPLPVGRKYEVNWNLLNKWNHSILGTFYDLAEDGLLDILLVVKGNTDYEMATFPNDLDLDATFLKVMVLSGVCYGNCTHEKVPYGTNLPGPFVSYNTTTQEGNPRVACAGQLSQSAHFALQLPYMTFGLGRTPNFVDSVSAGLSTPISGQPRHHDWTQIIPNSQVIIIPFPRDMPRQWLAKLFLRPGKSELVTFIALIGTCVFVGGIIGLLHWKEKSEDRKEKLQEAHRFHFDAL